MRDHLLDEKELQALTELSAAAKVQALEAMGFLRTRNSHSPGCTTFQGSGYICTCLAPESTWSAPAEVCRFLGESLAERRAYTQLRNAHENDGGGSPVKSWRI